MKTLVESCFNITTKRFNKDLKLAVDRKTNVESYINTSFGTVFDYIIEYGTENNYLIIKYAEEDQRIKLVDSELRYGTRMFFVCDCGAHVAKLYLPPNNKQFKCRCCHKLYYQSTTINRTSKHGEFLYKQNQILKIIDTREKMNRIFYRSRYTRRFLRWLGSCSRAGLFDEVIRAQELMTAVNNKQ
ncbi:MAG: hypothetical protein NTU76_03765 [Candidatus Taylorbacteria bacterium]|nr:hypothetical protein [Candidatus Taylorbacteria bacterium]